MEATRTAKFLITCIDAPECTVSFEPEGAWFTVRKEDRFTAEITGAGSGVVEVSYVPHGIIIGAWNGAKTSVWNTAGDRVEPGSKRVTSTKRVRRNVPRKGTE